MRIQFYPTLYNTLWAESVGLEWHLVSFILHIKSKIRAVEVRVGHVTFQWHQGKSRFVLLHNFTERHLSVDGEVSKRSRCWNLSKGRCWRVSNGSYWRLSAVEAVNQWKDVWSYSEVHCWCLFKDRCWSLAKSSCWSESRPDVVFCFGQVFKCIWGRCLIVSNGRC